jgi:Glycosyltransferase family 87
MIFEQGTRANRGLIVVMGLIVGVVCIWGIDELRAYMPLGIDLEIPLRAVSHWASGGQAYPPSAMLVQSGPDLPYLYPPFMLPLLSPIAALPRATATGVWMILCFLTAVWTCRRLAMPWPAIPFVLAWPPFAEGLITGNTQILSFAAFVALLCEPEGGAFGQRVLVPARDALNGVLAGAVGVLKVAQLLTVPYLARRRPRATVIGLAVMAALAAATLPLTGLAIYGDYLAQLKRAADPAWTIGGIGLGRQVGIPDVVPAVIALAIALSVRGRDSVAWLGVALVIASPSVHGYTFLFLLPALLTMRRDVAVAIGALFIGRYHTDLWWIAGALSVCMLLAMNRWPWLRLNGGESAEPAEPAEAEPA